MTRRTPSPHPAPAIAADEAVHRALRAIPRHEREAIALACLAGNTYREVATLLGRSEVTVKHEIRRGLARLGALLGR